MSYDLSDYVEVHERIEAFFERYPDGSFQGDYRIEEIEGKTIIVYCSTVYRTPDDQRPSIAYASEPFPGETPFTKDSEIMNAETSAIGRAIAALGFEVKRGMASRQEVENRGPSRSNGGGDPNREASEKQRDYATSLIEKADFAEDQLALIRTFCAAESGKFKASSASFLIENLKDGTTDGRSRILEMVGWSDVPGEAYDLPDTSDFEPDGKTAPVEEEEGIKF